MPTFICKYSTSAYYVTVRHHLNSPAKQNGLSFKVKYMHYSKLLPKVTWRRITKIYQMWPSWPGTSPEAEARMMDLQRQAAVAVHEMNFPKVSKLLTKNASIVKTRALTERSLSTGGNLVIHHRTALKPHGKISYSLWSINMHQLDLIFSFWIFLWAITPPPSNSYCTALILILYPTALHFLFLLRQ